MIILRTGHQIADTVADALQEGMPDCDAAIGYGILRGMDKALRANEHWFNVDRGYFNPGHFNGYYRISYKGTQARYYDGMQQYDDFRLQPIRQSGSYVLICPPTNAVCEFYSVNYMEWCNSALAQCISLGLPYIIRDKDNPLPLAHMLDNSYAVITFNSSVGWEAIRLGIPCVSDTEHSVVGSYYQQKMLEPVMHNFAEYSRERLFAFMRTHQFTLSEIRAGRACNLIKHYMSIAAGIVEKSSVATLQLTA